MNLITKIVTKRVPDSLLPDRVIAYRKDGSKLEAGDKFLRTALITLFSLITGEQLSPRDIRQYIEKKHIRVPRRVFSVL